MKSLDSFIIFLNFGKLFLLQLTTMKPSFPLKQLKGKKSYFNYRTEFSRDINKIMLILLIVINDERNQAAYF